MWRNFAALIMSYCKRSARAASLRSTKLIHGNGQCVAAMSVSVCGQGCARLNSDRRLGVGALAGAQLLVKHCDGGEAKVARGLSEFSMSADVGGDPISVL